MGSKRVPLYSDAQSRDPGADELHVPVAVEPGQLGASRQTVGGSLVTPTCFGGDA